MLALTQRVASWGMLARIIGMHVCVTAISVPKLFITAGKNPVTFSYVFAILFSELDANNSGCVWRVWRQLRQLECLMTVDGRRRDAKNCRELRMGEAGACSAVDHV